MIAINNFNNPAEGLCSACYSESDELFDYGFTHALCGDCLVESVFEELASEEPRWQVLHAAREFMEQANEEELRLFFEDYFSVGRFLR